MALFLSTGLLTPFALTSEEHNDAMPLRIAYLGPTTCALTRDGFVVVGDLLIANGAYDAAIQLGTPWPVLPGFDPRHVLVIRDSAAGELIDVDIELTNQVGEVIQSQTIDGVVQGQLSTGEILAWSEREGYFATSWTGARQEYEVAGHPVALIAGRSLVTAADQTLIVTNLITGEHWEAELDIVPEGITPIYDDALARVAIVQRSLGVLIVSEELVVQQPVPGNCAAVTWTHNDHLIIGTSDEFGMIGRGFDYDIVGDSLIEIEVPGGVFPLLDVTDRWSVDQVTVLESQQFEMTPPTYDDLKAQLSSAVVLLGVDAATVESLVDRCIGFRLRPVEQDELPIGATRFGGVPDLPIHRAQADSSWVTYDGRPYSFLAQLRCDELRAVLDDPELPSDGWFVVWVQLNDAGTYTDDEFAVNVDYHRDQPLERVEFASELPENHRFPSMAVAMRPQLTLLPWEEVNETVGSAAAIALANHVKSAWPDHRLFGQPDNGPKEGSDFFMKIASDEALGLFLRGDRGNGWLDISIPSHLPLMEALAETTIETHDY
jgi:Domain of unknown function (DUF1963)